MVNGANTFEHTRSERIMSGVWGQLPNAMPPRSFITDRSRGDDRIDTRYVVITVNSPKQ